MRVCVREHIRDRVCVGERECVLERECVCVSERESVCVCERVRASGDVSHPQLNLST